MAQDVNLDTQIPAKLDEKLSRLATARGTNKSRLICEALAEFVLSEEAFAAAGAEGRAEVDTGDLIDHEEVMREIRQLLAAHR
jgi:predicted transcriptional regulator